MPSSKCSLDLLLGLGILCLIPSLLRAQEPNEWPQSMFDSLSHDFGVVAKGSDVRHRFKITNRSSEDVHIASVTASCGCTGAKCDRFLLERNVSTVLEVSVDTNRFQRQKESSVTVSFDRPRAASVAIPVKACIRPDIVVSPSLINFGSVPHGQQHERTISIAYAGRPDWKIQELMTSDEHVQVHAVERHRAPGQIKYDLVVALRADVPIGMLRSEVVVVSNEENGPRFPVGLDASVEADFTVTPSVVQLGTLAPGAEITRTVVVRGAEPFAVKRVDCPSCSGAIKSWAADESTARVHLLPLTFIAPQECGEFSHRFVLCISSGVVLDFADRGFVERLQRTTCAH
jgi:Protein of unknown function (DUF1573)